MYYHVYGKNRWSKHLILIERNIRDEAEAKRKVKEYRETQGHDYTITLSKTHMAI